MIVVIVNGDVSLDTFSFFFSASDWDIFQKFSALIEKYVSKHPRR